MNLDEFVEHQHFIQGMNVNVNIVKMHDINFLLLLVLIKKRNKQCYTTGDGSYEELDSVCDYLNKSGSALKAERLKYAEQARKR